MKWRYWKWFKTITVHYMKCLCCDQWLQPLAKNNGQSQLLVSSVAKTWNWSCMLIMIKRNRYNCIVQAIRKHLEIMLVSSQLKISTKDSTDSWTTKSTGVLLRALCVVDNKKKNTKNPASFITLSRRC